MFQRNIAIPDAFQKFIRHIWEQQEQPETGPMIKLRGKQTLYMKATNQFGKMTLHVLSEALAMA
jgi:hypothetical protein